MDSRANTNLTADLLSPDVILCCGEDEDALLRAIPPRFSGPVQREFAFRAYHFWKFADHTLILSGIGTGCLEPLLYELFSFNIVRRIILVGTAGKMSGSTAAEIGKVYAIGEASLAGTGLDAIARGATFTPTLRAVPELPTATIVSTDLYYGFADTADPRYTERFQPGAPLWEQARNRDLVDMETGQFYALCGYLDSPKNHWEYLAIKGPANEAGSPEGQNMNTGGVLAAALESACAILGVRPRAAWPAAAPSTDRGDAETTAQRPAPPRDTTKMVQEIRLYWTMQIATVTALGYLAARLGEASLPALLVHLVIFALLTIGAVYNLVGNYHIHAESEHSGREPARENIITPYLGVMYCLIALLLGVSMANTACDVFGIDAANGFSPLLFLAIPIILTGTIYLLQAMVFRSLRQVGSAAYLSYARNLEKLFSLLSIRGKAGSSKRDASFPE